MIRQFFLNRTGINYYCWLCAPWHINTLYHARKITGVNQIYAVIGGVHLIEASEERINQTIDALQELNIKKIGLCHCTGLRAVNSLFQKFPNQFININSGTVLEF